MFLHMLSKFELIWTRIGQVIRLRNDITFFETPGIYAYISLNLVYWVSTLTFSIGMMHTPGDFNLVMSLIIIRIQIHNTNTGGKRQTRSFQIRTVLLTSDFGSSTRGERQFLLCWSYYADARRILWCLRSLSVEIRKTQLHASTEENSTLCFNGRELNCLPLWSNLNLQLTLFQNLPNSQDHLLGAWRHPHSSPISSLGVYYDNGDCHILCARA